ncbi:pyrroline-5-carboxylate reductase [Helicobacter monodelphidis]|uniref:pyrroline-5-carboxylate reductase n=1 Tax=Helicobacter sp. 15-1451 TaxID=2004995 RepID=UPI0011BEA0FA|nr:pyrroline-5-carboxylate reductase [Helicobacter sp. 15-1451]
MQKIYILGYGKMAEAIALSLSSYTDFSLCIAGRNQQKALCLAKKCECSKNQIEVCTGEDFCGQIARQDFLGEAILLFALKPYALSSVRINGHFKAVYSIAAFVTLKELELAFSADSFVRAMPNIAARHKKSFTALYAHKQEELASKVFGSCGQVFWLSSESKFEAGMAISGCSPAYLAMVAESLSDAGVREGLSREESNAFVRGLFEGFSALLQETHPVSIKEEVSSPSGTTIEGVALLESRALRSAFIDAIHAVIQKSRS